MGFACMRLCRLVTYATISHYLGDVWGVTAWHIHYTNHRVALGLTSHSMAP